MVNQYVDEGAPITDEEVEALKEELRSKVNLDELKTKNAAVLTTMMPIVLREMVNEAAGDKGAAAWTRELIARELNFALPTEEPKAKKTANKRDAQLKAKAQRAMVADLIAASRRGEINL